MGSTKRVPIDVRIWRPPIATWRRQWHEGFFRSDLFFRLNVLSLKIPPLRERKEDIPLLADTFWSGCRGAAGRERTLCDDAMTLMAYDWPGNVRELENCLERACALSLGTIQTADFLSPIQNATHPMPTEANEVPRSFRWPNWRAGDPGTIDSAQGRQAVAARLLGIGKTTLYRKLKEYATEDEGARRTDQTVVST